MRPSPNAGSDNDQSRAGTSTLVSSTTSTEQPTILGQPRQDLTMRTIFTLCTFSRRRLLLCCAPFSISRISYESAPGISWGNLYDAPWVNPSWLQVFMLHLTDLGDGVFWTRGMSDYQGHQRMTEEQVPILQEKIIQSDGAHRQIYVLNGLLK